MKYPPANVLVQYAYNPRKMLDTLIATKSDQPLFSEMLSYDKIGSIMGQIYNHGGGSSVTQLYGYDGLNRLISWYEDGKPVQTRYEYDKAGNRTKEDYFGSTLNPPHAYHAKTSSYLDAVGPNRLTGMEEDSLNALEQVVSTQKRWEYSHNADGGMKRRAEYTEAGMFEVLQKEKKFGYSYNSLLKRYTSGQYSGVADWDWRYRYSASGEREQKRSYVVPSNSGENTITASNPNIQFSK